MKAKVVYSINPKWFLADEDNIPSLIDVMCDYRLVAEMEVPSEESMETAREWVFAELNYNPEKWIPVLPDRVNHTSMSVGDIVYLEDGKERHAYLCIPVGWKELK